mmetsp:Transcript_720/g.2280  ORF Transcript_720/g.2280 Transcript_720/m.2280 type:complete len:364 (-) Transcript_720:160-1251(-)
MTMTLSSWAPDAAYKTAAHSGCKYRLRIASFQASSPRKEWRGTWQQDWPAQRTECRDQGMDGSPRPMATGSWRRTWNCQRGRRPPASELGSQRTIATFFANLQHQPAAQQGRPTGAPGGPNLEGQVECPALRAAGTSRLEGPGEGLEAVSLPCKARVCDVRTDSTGPQHTLVDSCWVGTLRGCTEAQALKAADTCGLVDPAGDVKINCRDTESNAPRTGGHWADQLRHDLGARDVHIVHGVVPSQRGGGCCQLAQPCCVGHLDGFALLSDEHQRSGAPPHVDDITICEASRDRMPDHDGVAAHPLKPGSKLILCQRLKVRGQPHDLRAQCDVLRPRCCIRQAAITYQAEARVLKELSHGDKRP